MAPRFTQRLQGSYHDKRASTRFLALWTQRVVVLLGHSVVHLDVFTLKKFFAETVKNRDNAVNVI
jgi:hypothetical protein